MTISSTTRKAGPYTGTGSVATYPFAFKIFQASDLLVVKTTPAGIDSNLVLTTDYTVSANADQNSNPGGSITLTAGNLASGYLLTLTSQVPNTQTTDLTNQGGFYPAVITNALDKLTIEVQQLQLAVDRSAKLPISSTTDADALVSDIVRLASSADNVDTVATNVTDVNTVAGNTTNINTVATNDSNVSTVAGIASNVTTVAGIASNVTAVAGNATNINTVATNNANVSTVATNIASVNTNASNITAITTNATNITDIQNAATNAANAATSATNAASSATAASASAAAAAAAAAAGLYRQVLDKSANYTILAADAGTLFRANTGSGALTFTLPAISSVSDGYKVSVVKWTSDGNVVNVNRTGSDTINGGTTVQIQSQYSQIIFVADFETNTWFASQSGLGATNKNVDVFTGNASTTIFTLTADPGSKNNTDVYVAGIHQAHATYSVSGITLTFSTAPPSGANNIQVVYGTPLAIGTPSDGTVTTAKIADLNVTSAKLAVGAALSNLGFTPATDSLTMHLAGAETATGAKRGAVVALTDAATITPDFNAGNNFSVTLGGNRTLANPTNQTAGQGGVITVTQDGTGSRTLAYGSNWKFASGTAPTLTTTAAAVDVIAYYVESASRITARFIGDTK